MDSIDISGLTTDARLALIGRLWNSLDQDSLLLTAAQKAEFARRLATADADLADSIPWETFRTGRATRRQ
jgi:putative addiction module component (TIGR02574 family)